MDSINWTWWIWEEREVERSGKGRWIWKELGKDVNMIRIHRTNFQRTNEILVAKSQTTTPCWAFVSSLHSETSSKDLPSALPCRHQWDKVVMSQLKLGLRSERVELRGSIWRKCHSCEACKKEGSYLCLVSQRCLPEGTEICLLLKVKHALSGCSGMLEVRKMTECVSLYQNLDCFPEQSRTQHIVLTKWATQFYLAFKENYSKLTIQCTDRVIQPIREGIFKHTGEEDPSGCAERFRDTDIQREGKKDDSGLAVHGLDHCKDWEKNQAGKSKVW